MFTEFANAPARSSWSAVLGQLLVDPQVITLGKRSTNWLMGLAPRRFGLGIQLLLSVYCGLGVVIVWYLLLVYSLLRFVLLPFYPLLFLIPAEVRRVGWRWITWLLTPPKTGLARILYVCSLPLRVAGVIVVVYAVFLVSLLGGIALLFSFAVLLGMGQMLLLPGVALYHGVDSRDLALRSLDTHALNPFYVLQGGESFRRSESRSLGRSAGSHGNRIEVWNPTPTETKNMQRGLATLYDLDDTNIRKQLSAWGEMRTSQVWGSGIFVLRASHTQISGTEEQQLLFAWQKLCAHNPYAERDLPKLGELFRQAYPEESERVAALAWARTLYTRYQTNAAAQQRQVLLNEQRESLPPLTEATLWWLLYQYVGLTEESRQFARQRWLSYFPPDNHPDVLRWGRQLEADRRTNGEALPPTADNVALVCVIERYTGTDRNGETCRRILAESVGPSWMSGPLFGAISFAYPNDDLFYIVAGGDPLALMTPQPGNLLDVLLYLLLISVGLRLWVFGVLGYPLRHHPAFIRFRNRDFQDWRGFVIAYAIAPLVVWSFTWLTLAPELRLWIASPLQSFVGAFAAVVLGGNFVLLLTRLISLLLIARGYDLERTWLDEILGAGLGAGVLLYFGNDLIAIAAFVVFAVLPEVLARRKPRSLLEFRL